MKSDLSFQEGALVAQGEFHLDHQKALAKLREFQLPSPYHYCLEFVKAAHLFGASEIRFHLDTREVQISFDASGPTTAELSDLYSRAFSRREDSHQLAIRHLAVGVNSAWALDLQEVLLICLGETPFGIRLLKEGITPLSPDEIQQILKEKKSRPHTPGPEVFVQLHKTAHPRRLLRFANRLTGIGQLPETALLTEKCRYAKIDVIVDDEEVSQKLFLENSSAQLLSSSVVYRHHGEAGFLSLRALQNPKEKGVQTLMLLQCSVLLRTYTLPSPFLDHDLRVIVDTPHLHTNLSQTEVTQDEEWRKLQDRIHFQALRLRKRCFATQLQQRDFSAPRALRRQIIETIFLVLDVASADPLLDELLEVVAQFPVFERAYPASQRPEDLLFSLQDAAQTGLLKFTQVYHRSNEIETDPQILWLSRQDFLNPDWSDTHDIPSFLHLFAEELQDFSRQNANTDPPPRKKRPPKKTHGFKANRFSFDSPKDSPRQNPKTAPLHRNLPPEEPLPSPRDEPPSPSIPSLGSTPPYSPAQKALLELLFEESGPDTLLFMERFEFFFIEGPGEQAVDVQIRISGNRADIDIHHPLFQDYWDHPEDPVSRAFAVIPIFSAFNAYRLHDTEESRRSTTREKRIFLRRVLNRASSPPPSPEERVEPRPVS